MPFNYDFEDNTPDVDELIREYHERNQRKLDDEKWLKANKPAIVSTMNALGKEKKDFGNLRVSIVTPDESKFDNEKIIAFIQENHPGLADWLIEQKPVINEARLEEAIMTELLCSDALHEVAWIEKTGTPRVTVKAL
ncbi:hypothetical protein [Paenibacillus xylanexedens]|uniref:hypothetical protein n=1 Tax=Paenibacillus xylanexedens TaxID=528191 RepID=UPI0011AB1EA8|nr:hypothetical protein [Paenibacillus xylanexedens]